VGGGGGEKFLIYWFNSKSLNIVGGGEVFNLLAEFQIFKFLWGGEGGEIFNLLI
jgi:hypothetical protein